MSSSAYRNDGGVRVTRGQRTILSYLCRVNISVGECHWHVVPVHYFPAQMANNGGVGMVTERYLFRENTDIRVTHWTIDVVHEIITSGQLERSESGVERKVQKWFRRQAIQ